MPPRGLAPLRPCDTERVGDKLPKAGLSIGYRVGWQIRRVLFTLFGPAQLGSSSDPVERLKRERRRKSAAAVAAKADKDSGAHG